MTHFRWLSSEKEEGAVDLSEGVYSGGGVTLSQEIRARKILRIVLWLIALLSATWATVLVLIDGTSSASIAIALNACISLVAIGTLFFDKRLAYRVLVYCFLAVAFSYIWFLQLKVEGLSHAATPSINLWFLALAVAAVLLLFRESRWVLAGFEMIVLVSFAASSFGFIESAPIIALSEQGKVIAYGMTYVTVFATVALLALAWAGEVRSAEAKLVIANNRMEELLANMLPPSISDRLRREGKTFADGVSDCSVMFADIVGFTKISSDITPDDLVRLLDEIFSHFDELTARAGLEKIKTIGDSYMVAAGIPDPRADHAQSLVRLAMEMQAVIRRYGLHLRCGINSGSVVAGVIGRKRFIYDLWGETVNVAAHTESQGVVDEIQVTEATAHLIQREFKLVSREDIFVRGRANARVFLVAGVDFAASRSLPLQGESIKIASLKDD